MNEKNLFVAEVIDNDDNNHPDDPTQQNRIQIYIAAFMSGFIKSHLPWARPASSLFGGGSNQFGGSFIPEIGSKVWIFFENPILKKNPFYIADLSLSKLNSAKLFEEKVKTEIEGLSSSYPDVKFIHLKNGINLAISSGNAPEVSIFHPEGSYIFLSSEGEIHIKGGKASLESSVLGETLKEILDEMIEAIMQMSLMSPVGPTTAPPINAGQFALIKSKLSKILSKKIKNN